MVPSHTRKSTGFPISIIVLLSILLLFGILYYARSTSSRPATGPTPISAVREHIARRYPQQPEIVDSFHALTTLQVGTEVIVLFEAQAPSNLGGSSSRTAGKTALRVCIGIARPKASYWGTYWESGYFPSRECYAPGDVGSFSPSQTDLQSFDGAGEPFLFGPAYGDNAVWVFYGRVHDPRITTMEIITQRADFISTTVTNKAFLEGV